MSDKDDDLPELDELMVRYGLSLTEALAFWAKAASAPPEIRRDWRLAFKPEKPTITH